MEKVTAPPYDTMSPAEQRRFRDASPYNVVRLDLAEDLPGDDGPEAKYMRAASELSRWRTEDILVPSDGPTHYAYEMRFRLQGLERCVRGVICLVDLEDWGGSIVPHEMTMPGPVEDRLRLMRATRVNLSCVHAVYPGPCPRVADLLLRASDTEPVAQLTDEAGVEHRMWALGDEDEISRSLADQVLLIADGHHRYTMALRYRDEMRAEHGPGPWDRVMMLLVDAATEDPPVLPVHRILTAGTIPPRGARVRDLQEILNEVDDDALLYGMATNEGGALVHRVAALSGRPPTVGALHEQVLRGVDEDLLYTPDPVQAEEQVREGRAYAAFFLPATTAARIRSAVDRGDRLPQKSTYFWPKPRTGVVIRALD